MELRAQATCRRRRSPGPRSPRRLAVLAAAALSTSVSCSVFFETTLFAAEQPASAAASRVPLGPTSVDWVAGQFTHYRTRLAPF